MIVVPVAGRLGRPRLATMTYPVRPSGWCGARCAGDRDGYNSFHVLDLDRGREVFTVGPRPGLYAEGSIDLSPDGSLLATGEWSKVRLLPVGSERPMWSLEVASIPRLTFSPDARYLFVANEFPSRPQLVDVGTGEANVLFPGHFAQGESWFSADGARMLFGHTAGVATGITLGITVWDVVSDQEIASAPSQLGVAYALSPDGALVAATRPVDGAVELLAADTLDPIRTFPGQVSEVTEIAFDLDGRRIAAAGLDGTVNVWDVQTGDRLLTAPAELSVVNHISFNEDGSRLIVVYGDGMIVSHPIALEEAIEIASSRVTRSFTDAECRRYLHATSCPV